MIAQLNAHSCFSLLEGLPEPAELAAAARAGGVQALALTDHNLLTGAVPFYQACREAGVQPILGLEVDLALPGGTARASLLAEDITGWRSLCRLSSALMLRGEESPVAGAELLGQHSSGLLALAVDGLELLGELFPGRCYAALPPAEGLHAARAGQVLAQARRLNLPVAAAAPLYYLTPEDAPRQRLSAAIRGNTTLGALAPGAAAPPLAYFRGAFQLERVYRDLPGALAGADEAAQRCRVELPLGVPHLPAVAVPPGLTPAEYLRRQAEEGARRLYGRITPTVQARLNHELEVIAGRGFEPIFLIVQELLNFARSAQIPTASRGSASSSLVAHCLGITTPDPLALDLYFERFLNPARATPPDIDTDLCSRRRDSVIQHVFDRYGEDRVAMVGTINRYRPRSALSDVAKAHGFPPAEIRMLTAQLPYWFFHADGAEDAQPASETPYRELESRFPAARYRPVFQEAAALLGVPRHLSVHAGGIVVTPGPLTDLLPVQRANKGIRITQLDHKMLEPLGVVKLDLLGIRGLTVLGDVAERIYSWRRSEFSAPLQVLDAIPQEDAETAACIRGGQTIGCFQIESPGMRTTLKEIHAQSVADLMVALALYRPGPLTGGLKDAFVRRHNQQETVTHIHPALAPLVEDTYGVILYQEQVLRIAHELGGFTLAESDLLRRAMSHFDPGKQMQTLKEKFIAGANARHGIEPATAERVWELMAAFAGYGFPKAHAASYAQVAWQSAWCKTHFPAEFMAAVLANWGGYYSQRVYLMEARRLGLQVRPPHINHSRREFSVVYPGGNPVLYMGLDQVKDLTARTQERIQRLRPFHSLEDFLTRANPRKEEAASLIRCGALDGLGQIPSLLERLEHTAHRAGQPALFAWVDADNTAEGDWPLAETIRAQEEILGISVNAHPLELVVERIRASGAISTLDAAARTGERVKIAGVRQISHRSRAASGEMLRYFSFEDLEGMVDVVVFPDVYRRFRALFNENKPLLVEGVIQMEANRDEPVLRAEKFFPL